MINVIEQIFKKVFNENSFPVENVKIITSNRPDLCDFQCDDVFKLTKEYRKSPIEIGELLTCALNEIDNFSTYFKKIEFVKPGFINIVVSDELITTSVKEVINDINTNLDFSKKEKYVIDFGGANVAKPLHVGHMRTAVVGESIRRIIKYFNNEIISDTHLGDFGLQIGQVIYGIKKYNIDLNELDIKFLDKIYPEMSSICKEDEEIKEACALIVKDLQDGDLELRKYWEKIFEVSVADIRKNYDYLSAHFDLWYGESHSFEYIKGIKEILNNKNLLKESNGALIVEVEKDTDKATMPPLVFQKSNGAYLYSTTDLATMLQRKLDFNPDHILYVVDNRQELHFEQVFRTADLCGLYNYDSLEFLGYGTVNGEDGKPYKTRSGDNPKLENLFINAKELFVTKKESNKDMSDSDLNIIVNAIIKFADLINFRKKDYVFDLNKFSEVSGKTGPYILYTYLRINKILEGNSYNKEITNKVYNEFDRNLRLQILNFAKSLNATFYERKPHYLAEYVYDLCVACNIFYQNNHITGLDDETVKNDWLNILAVSNEIIKTSLDLLGIDIPTTM